MDEDGGRDLIEGRIDRWIRRITWTDVCLRPTRPAATGIASIASCGVLNAPSSGLRGPPNELAGEWEAGDQVGDKNVAGFRRTRFVMRKHYQKMHRTR